MQMKLKLTVVAALATLAGMATAQDMVVKIGHVAPLSGSQAHYGKDNENGVRMAVEDLNTQNIVIAGKKVIRELIQADATPEHLAAEIERLMDYETAHIQMLQHLSMHKQLISGDTEDPVKVILNSLQPNQ